MGGFNIQELMSQAKKQYETLQKKMEETVVEATSGGGSVTASRRMYAKSSSILRRGLRALLCTETKPRR